MRQRATPKAREDRKGAEGGEALQRFGTQSHEKSRRFARVERSKRRDGREEQPEKVGLKASELETSYISKNNFRLFQLEIARTCEYTCGSSGEAGGLE